MENEPAERDAHAVRENVGGPHGRGPLREHAWLFASFALLAAAAVLLWLARTDAAFVAAALGVSAWFLDVREGLKRRHDLVKLSGRNWIPRDELDDADDPDYVDDVDESDGADDVDDADDADDVGGSGGADDGDD
jgi:hypothetical protein